MSPGQSTLATHNLRQTAVYWSSPTNDGHGGRTFDEPTETMVRWEERQEMFVDALGREVRSSAVVYAGRDLDLGGYLYLGTLNDLASDEEADPMIVNSAREIRSMSKIPDIRARRFFRKVWL